jgi:NADH:ubiquinone reductase (H+-translocating)
MTMTGNELNNYVNAAKIKALYSRSRYMRPGLTGLLAGLVSSFVLATTLESISVAVLLGSVVGIAYVVAFRNVQRQYIDSVMTAAALGIPLWVFVSTVLFPLIAGQSPRWTVEGMRTMLPELIAWTGYGAVLGVVAETLRRITVSWIGPDSISCKSPKEATKQIVILGGGFAGVATAERLERVFGADRKVSFTLVSDTNALLFTPMLAEVAGSSLEPSHISSPLRSSLRRTQVVRGCVVGIDLEKRCVSLATNGRSRGTATLSDVTEELLFDHLVLALGSVTNYPSAMQNLKEFALDFKTLSDAMRIRNRVIDMFERADRESDPGRRQELLTFVIAGGGFAGVELAGALNDFARGILADYLNLRAGDVCVILVHARDRILPELSERLGRYALERMTARGVTFKLNERLADARTGLVILESGEEIRTQTLVWTAGTVPNPLLGLLPINRDKRGAVIVDSALTVPGHQGLWALGDCAAASDGKTGRPYPPTAQVAFREAYTLAHNIHASLKGRKLRPFRFRSRGALCVIGYHTACAELAVPFVKEKSVQFSGLFAWLMWRGIYLSKLRGLDRKVRVLTDWLIELFFPRDIVQMIELHERAYDGNLT